MKILHVVSNLTPGGAELMMYRLIAEHKKGGDVHLVISLRDKSTVGAMLQEIGVKVVVLEMKGLLSAPSALRRLVHLIRQFKPDVVQTWMYHADLIGGLAARAAGVRGIIWGVRTTHIPPGRGTSPLTTVIRRVCAILSSIVPQQIVYVAESARLLHEELGYDARKSILIPNGYEIPKNLTGATARVELQQRFGIPPGATVIGSAGRYNALKDYPTFIKAAQLVAADGADVHFLVAGRGLTPENFELSELIADAGLTDRFHLIGEQQGLSKFLASIDIFCLHSLSEGFPNVLSEAMAMALPCVSTNVGDAALILGNAGLLVPPECSTSLADALQVMLQKSKVERQGLGAEARERIVQRFSLGAVSSNYATLYAEIAGIDPREKLTVDTSGGQAHQLQR